MTRPEAIQHTRERWNRMGIREDQAPLTFESDVNTIMGCMCVRLFFSESAPHSVACPCYVPPANPELNQKLNAELNEQFRNGTLDTRFDGYDA